MCPPTNAKIETGKEAHWKGERGTGVRQAEGKEVGREGGWEGGKRAYLASVVHELLQLLLAVVLLGDQAGGPGGLGAACPCARPCTRTSEAALQTQQTGPVSHTHLSPARHKHTQQLLSLVHVTQRPHTQSVATLGNLTTLFTADQNQLQSRLIPSLVYEQRADWPLAS